MEMMVFKQPGLRLLWAGFALMFWVLAIGGCGTPAPRFAGTYVSKVESAGNEVYDTLRVEKVSGGVYLLHRSSRFRIESEEVGAREWKLEREEWTADLSEATGLLIERRHGRRISLDKESGDLRVASRRYKKIK